MPPRRGRRSGRTTRSRRDPSLEPEEEAREEEEVQETSEAVSQSLEVKAEDEQADEDEDVSAPQGADDDADDAAPDSDQADDASDPSTPIPLSPPRPRRGRGRGRGRGGATRQSGWSTPDVAGDDGSDAGTPARRGRGRGRAGYPRGGFRGRARGAKAAQVTRVPIDKEGNMTDVIDDEVVLPEDPEGEEKVDKNGELLGGREYRVRTFTLAGRNKRLYMLSTEPARCTGFRDSYLFFNKHLSLFKCVIEEYEKRDLIEREVIPHSYKGRAIGVVTARSVFREFGSKIVVGGKKVIDDYHATRARERGDVEGELADPFDRLPEPGEKYNRNQFVAWHGASSVYHSQGPNMPMQGAKPLLSGKRRANITSSNWMYEHAMAATTFNSALNVMRKATFDGVYDAHTNMMCYPAIMQPTHARWDPVETPPQSPPLKRRKLAPPNASSPFTANGAPKPTPAFDNGASATHSDFFPEPSSFLKNNYLIADMHLSTPPSSLFAIPNHPPSLAVHHPLSSPDFSAGRPPHLGIPSLSEAEMDDVDLPEECRKALREARRAQAEWTGQWGGIEAKDGSRGTLKLGVGLPRDI